MSEISRRPTHWLPSHISTSLPLTRSFVLYIHGLAFFYALTLSVVVSSLGKSFVHALIFFYALSDSLLSLFLKPQCRDEVVAGNLTLAGTSRLRPVIKAAEEAEVVVVVVDEAVVVVDEAEVGVAKAEEEEAAVLLQASLRLHRPLLLRRILVRPHLYQPFLRLDLLQRL